MEARGISLWLCRLPPLVCDQDTKALLSRFHLSLHTLSGVARFPLQCLLCCC